MTSQFVKNVYLAKEMLEVTPSQARGLPAAKEGELRRFGCELIQEAGILLRMPQMAIATAQVLLQRFYYRSSIFEFKNIAMGSILIASKLEETQKKLKDIINVFHHIEVLRTGGDAQRVLTTDDKIWWELRKDLLEAENEMLKRMGFQVYVEHPHKYLLNYLRVLGIDQIDNLAQRAWNYANDSLRTDLCVRFTPQQIATACIYITCTMMRIGLPEQPPWWNLFDTTKEQMDEIAWNIMQLYKVSLDTLSQTQQAKPAPPPPPESRARPPPPPPPSSSPPRSRRDRSRSRSRDRRRSSRSRSRGGYPRSRSRSRDGGRRYDYNSDRRRDRSRSRSRDRDRFRDNRRDAGRDRDRDRDRDYNRDRDRDRDRDQRDRRDRGR